MKSKRRARAGPSQSRLPSSFCGESPPYSGRVQLGITPRERSSETQLGITSKFREMNAHRSSQPLPHLFCYLGSVLQIKVKTTWRKVKV